MDKLLSRLHRNFNSTRLVALSFGAIILIGTLLLLLPVASATGRSHGLMTALFTATSATCVTGLSLVDTLTGWSLFGQIVILVMIQFGGLGFMTIITLFSLAMQRRINLTERLMMMSTLNLNDMDGVVGLVRTALRVTFATEGICAVILALRFIPRYGLFRGMWTGLFVSVSAMCNAGFDLMGPDGGGSLSTFQNDPVVLITVMFLITFGGLGFLVWDDLGKSRCWKKLRLYSKLVLGMTAVLILGGAVYFFCAEYSNPATLGGMPLGQKLLNALFQSVTLRTAGFFTFDQGGLYDSSIALSCVFMLIGGSSGSTAGGLKTVTVAVLLLAVRAGLRGQSEITVRRRSIPVQRVLNALTLCLVVLILFFTGAMVISLMDDVSFLQAAFEAASAIGTVGLTTGITASLSPLSHVLLICMMYLGRVGILSFSLAFLTHGRYPARIQYPAFDLLIG